MSLTKRDEFLAAAAKLADGVLVIGGVLACLTLVNFFYHYRFTGQRVFISPLYYLLYYVCPLALAAYLFASLWFTPAHRVRLAIVIGTSLAPLYGLELFLELGGPSHKYIQPVMTVLAEDSSDRIKNAAALSKEWGVEIDARTGEEVLAAFRNKGVDAVPIVAPSNQLFVREPDGSIRSALSIGGREVMPLGALANKETLLCNENGQFVHYRSDIHGFSNPTDAWQAKRLQIAALGDSFTHGYCVPTERSFVGLIRQHYPATLNLGMAGNGPLLMLASLREYLPPFKPKAVLWFYFEGNDLANLQDERRSALLRAYLNDGFTQSSLAQQSDIDQAIMDELPRLRALEQSRKARRDEARVIGRLLDFVKVSALRGRAGLVGGIDANERRWAAELSGDKNLEVFREALLRAKFEVGAWGGRLYFAYLPSWAGDLESTTVGSEARCEVLATVHNLDVPIIDLVPVFQAHDDPLSLFPFRAPGHYNEMGHGVVAERVLAALASDVDLQATARC